MAKTLRPKDSIIGSASALTLDEGERLVVDRGIVLSSADSAGVVALGDNELIIKGAVAGHYAIDAADSTISIGAYGVIAGETLGVSTGGRLVLDNHGIISGSYQGVSLYGSGTITNHGSILSGLGDDELTSAIYLGSSHTKATIVNLGTIKAKLDNSYAILSSTGNDAPDTVINSGSIIGNVYLSSGDDRFDTTSGRIDGAVDGGPGKDILKGGKFSDHLIGGAGSDRLTGGSGSDVFEFASNAGEDVITDFDALGGGKSQDYLLLLNPYISERSVHHGRDTLLDFGEGNTITLLHVKADEFSKDDVHFII